MANSFAARALATLKWHLHRSDRAVMRRTKRKEKPVTNMIRAENNAITNLEKSLQRLKDGLAIDAEKGLREIGRELDELDADTDRLFRRLVQLATDEADEFRAQFQTLLEIEKEFQPVLRTGTERTHQLNRKKDTEEMRKLAVFLKKFKEDMEVLFVEAAHIQGMMCDALTKLQLVYLDIKNYADVGAGKSLLMSLRGTMDLEHVAHRQAVENRENLDKIVTLKSQIHDQGKICANQINVPVIVLVDAMDAQHQFVETARALLNEVKKSVERERHELAARYETEVKEYRGVRRSFQCMDECDRNKTFTDPRRTRREYVKKRQRRINEVKRRLTGIMHKVERSTYEQGLQLRAMVRTLQSKQGIIQRLRESRLARYTALFMILGPYSGFQYGAMIGKTESNPELSVQKLGDQEKAAARHIGDELSQWLLDKHGMRIACDWGENTPINKTDVKNIAEKIATALARLSKLMNGSRIVVSLKGLASQDGRVGDSSNHNREIASGRVDAIQHLLTGMLPDGVDLKLADPKSEVVVHKDVTLDEANEAVRRWLRPDVYGPLSDGWRTGHTWASLLRTLQYDRGVEVTFSFVVPDMGSPVVIYVADWQPGFYLPPIGPLPRRPDPFPPHQDTTEEPYFPPPKNLARDGDLVLLPPRPIQLLLPPGKPLPAAYPSPREIGESLGDKNPEWTKSVEEDGTPWSEIEEKYDWIGEEIRKRAKQVYERTYKLIIHIYSMFVGVTVYARLYATIRAWLVIISAYRTSPQEFPVVIERRFSKDIYDDLTNKYKNLEKVAIARARQIYEMAFREALMKYGGPTPRSQRLAWNFARKRFYQAWAQYRNEAVSAVGRHQQNLAADGKQTGRLRSSHPTADRGRHEKIQNKGYNSAGRAPRKIH